MEWFKIFFLSNIKKKTQEKNTYTHTKTKTTESLVEQTDHTQLCCKNVRSKWNKKEKKNCPPNKCIHIERVIMDTDTDTDAHRHFLLKQYFDEFD
jgi:hypothetical protein